MSQKVLKRNGGLGQIQEGDLVCISWWKQNVPAGPVDSVDGAFETFRTAPLPFRLIPRQVDEITPNLCPSYDSANTAGDLWPTSCNLMECIRVCYGIEACSQTAAFLCCQANLSSSDEPCSEIGCPGLKLDSSSTGSELPCWGIGCSSEESKKPSNALLGFIIGSFVVLGVIALMVVGAVLFVR